MYKLFYFFIKYRNNRFFGKTFTAFLKLMGLELPQAVKLGENVKFEHLATGSVIHPACKIEDDVRIYQGVTIGRADAYSQKSLHESIVIKEGAILSAGAKILCKKGVLTVGCNTVIGANAVLLKSTGDNEIWAGVPARKISDRIPENG